MQNVNGFDLSGKHMAVFIRMAVQSYPITQAFAALLRQQPKAGS